MKYSLRNLIRRPATNLSFLGISMSLQMLLVTMLLLLARFAEASSTSQLRRLTNSGLSYNLNKNQMDDYVMPPPRVVIEPFKLQMSKFASYVSDLDMQSLLSIMETVVFDYMVQKGGRRLTAGTLQYVKFGAVLQNYAADVESVTVTVQAGVASYSNDPTPDPASVNTWVKESLQTNLVSSLRKNVSFASVNKVSFALVNPPSTVGSVAGISGTTTPTVERGVNVPVIAGSVAAAACVLALVFLAATRRRARHTVKVENMVDLQLDEQQQPNERPKRALMLGAAGGKKYSDKNQSPRSVLALPGVSEDGRSLADSESEWTVATEAGDSMALKSIYPNSLLQNLGQGGVGNNHDLGLTLSESFERDRQVAITKDMLTGQWSGAVSHNRNGRGGPQSESVLQPSHFSASQERRVRKAAKAAAATDTNDIINDSMLDDLVFEQAHEDEEQLGQVSPPSQTNKRRTRNRSPPPRSGSGEIM